jgi:hypothetical protein
MDALDVFGDSDTSIQNLIVRRAYGIFLVLSFGFNTPPFLHTRTRCN